VSFLDRVHVEKEAEVAALLDAPPSLAGDLPAIRSLSKALSSTGVSAIAEIKRSSPTRGPIRPDLHPIDIAKSYEQNGAAAISVLTDRPHFGGSLNDIRDIRSCVDLPLLRKDFLIHPIQIDESRAAGADAILLIVAMLDDRTLHTMLKHCTQLGMEALVEVHTADELHRAIESPARIIGINNRDLQSLEIDLGNGEALLPQCPSDRIRVAESGVFVRKDVERMTRAGADAILVGSSLMLADNPGHALESLLCG